MSNNIDYDIMCQSGQLVKVGSCNNKYDFDMMCQSGKLGQIGSCKIMLIMTLFVSQVS